jgi:restriction system protein
LVVHFNRKIISPDSSLASVRQGLFPDSKVRLLPATTKNGSRYQSTGLVESRKQGVAMTINPHWAYYRTVLKIGSENGPIHRKTMRELAAKASGITPEEFEFTNERGTNIFNSRIHWAVMDMVGIGAFQRTSRGFVEITPMGRELLTRFPKGFSRKEVEALPEWAEWKNTWSGKNGRKETSSASTTEAASELTPDERLDAALDELNANLASELVRKIQSLKPVALERLVLQLLHAMGYGDSEESMSHLGGSGDEGVDGVINLDQLGLQKIYIQAKRYRDGSPITPTTIQAFIGALDSKRAVGGVFITTSDFTKAAVEAATKSSRHIELINGGRLGELLIENQVGVRTIQIVHRSELDEAHFEDLDS